jgi:hypothetical protein
MTTPVKNLVKTHSEHGWEKQSTDHIKNVSLIESHYLMKCPCNWYGWVKKVNIDQGVDIPKE